MDQETPGAARADDLPFLGPAVSPRRREPVTPAEAGEELPAPFVSHAGGQAGAFPGGGAGADALAGAAEGGAEEVLEELEVLPGAEYPRDDFPWLLPAEEEGGAPETGGAAPAEGYRWESVSPVEAEEDEGFPWDVPEAGGRGAEVRGFGWEGEPSLGYDDEQAAPLPELGAVAEGWDDRSAHALPAEGAEVAPEEREAAAFVWEEEGEEVESLTTEAPTESGWGWSAAEPEESPDLPAADRWERAGEEFAVAEEGGEAERWSLPEPEVVDAAAIPVAQWEEEVVEVAASASAEAAPAAAEAALPSPEALADVATRLESIARALRGGTPGDALQQGDPLQLLITGYALGYAEARKGKQG